MKCFPHQAAVGPFSSVNSLVCFKVVLCCEVFSTMVTAVLFGFSQASMFILLGRQKEDVTLDWTKREDSCKILVLIICPLAQAGINISH